MKENHDMISHLRLKLAAEHPDLESCWQDGYVCAQEDLEEKQNPFAKSTLEHEHWLEGWWAGFYDEDQHSYSLEVAAASTMTVATVQEKANHRVPANDRAKRMGWLGSVMQIIGAFATSVAVYELIDLAA